MPAVILPKEVSQALSQLSEPVELRDEDGTFLGRFEPGLSEADRRLLEQLRRDGYPGSLADFRAAQAEVRKAIENPEYARNWRTTEEIMADLKSRP